MTIFISFEIEWPDVSDASKAEALAELGALFAALQHRAFRGKL
jgi:hypothetical protein